MRRVIISIAVLALILGASELSMPGATYASTQLTASCHPHGRRDYFTLKASAWYTTPTSTYHHWTGTSFWLSGEYNENNIDIWVYAGNNIWAHRGADNIAGSFHYDSTRYPDFALNVDTPSYLADEHVAFRAIFDLRGTTFPESDPYCTTVTHNI